MKSPSTLMSEAWNLYKNNWQLLSGVYIVVLVVAIPFEFLAISIDESIVLDPAAISSGLLLFAALIIINILMGIAMVRSLSNPSESTIGSAYSFAKGYFWSYLWIGFLIGIIVTIGLILLIIPGIIFGVWYTFAAMALLFENKRGMEALRTSREYVRGRWWKVFGRLCFLALIVMLAALVYGFAVGIIFGDDDSIVTILTQLLNVVIVPLSIAYTYIMYKDISSLYPADPLEGTADSENSTSSNPVPKPETTNQDDTKA